MGSILAHIVFVFLLGGFWLFLMLCKGQPGEKILITLWAFFGFGFWFFYEDPTVGVLELCLGKLFIGVLAFIFMGFVLGADRGYLQ